MMHFDLDPITEGLHTQAGPRLPCNKYNFTGDKIHNLAAQNQTFLYTQQSYFDKIQPPLSEKNCN